MIHVNAPETIDTQTRDSARFDAVDGVILGLLTLLAAALNPQNHHWPGWIDLAQVALWVYIGLLFAGPFVLLKQRWLSGRREPWDLGEQLWFWIPSSWLASFVFSWIFPQNPLLLIMFAAVHLLAPVVIITGSYALCVSFAAATRGRGRWTSGCGSAISTATGVYVIVYLIRNPLVI